MALTARLRRERTIVRGRGTLAVLQVDDISFALISQCTLGGSGHHDRKRIHAYASRLHSRVKRHLNLDFGKVRIRSPFGNDAHGDHLGR
ncbi:hypothetical protein LshimejAT787_1002530 [Lyophyllum shimeji]|uniref:Uncharacterized protein n=1 Tax=Lyophyllum shimeji TaxID=47721 RepID=A0A9P3PTB2_LYOSH|nr:hypothetical protein LshimejAT787_1002530 [Lyophyllum shimeji]